MADHGQETVASGSENIVRTDGDLMDQWTSSVDEYKKSHSNHTAPSASAGKASKPESRRPLQDYSDLYDSTDLPSRNIDKSKSSTRTIPSGSKHTSARAQKSARRNRQQIVHAEEAKADLMVGILDNKSQSPSNNITPTETEDVYVLLNRPNDSEETNPTQKQAWKRPRADSDQPRKRHAAINSNSKGGQTSSEEKQHGNRKEDEAQNDREYYENNTADPEQIHTSKSIPQPTPGQHPWTSTAMPPFPNADGSAQPGQEGLSNMIMAWYYCGYYTGLHQARKHTG